MVSACKRQRHTSDHVNIQRLRDTSHILSVLREHEVGKLISQMMRLADLRVWKIKACSRLAG